MLEGTPIWTPGGMHLWVNNKPAHVYVPKSNPKQAYELLQSRLSKEGKIPIGIDHLPDNIIKANPILAKLNLLDVGNITEIEYTDDAIKIVEAELTNPLIRDLYEAGELDMVSIVANSTTSECPRGDYDYIVDTTDITRVDIVEKGACPTCNIPKPTASDEPVVYARYSIRTTTTTQTEENNMADEITMDAIKEAIAEAIAPIDERLTAIEDAVEIEASNSNHNEEDDAKVKEMEARIAELQKETATAKVDSLIAAGKILPAQKEAMVDLCASNSESFEKMMEDAPVLIDLNTRESLLAGDSNEGEGEESEDDIVDVVNNAFQK